MADQQTKKVRFSPRCADDASNDRDSVVPLKSILRDQQKSSRNYKPLPSHSQLPEKKKQIAKLIAHKKEKRLTSEDKDRTEPENQELETEHINSESSKDKVKKQSFRGTTSSSIDRSGNSKSSSGTSTDSKMSGFIMDFNTMSRMHEKQELQNINDRFSNYVQMVRSIRDQSSQVESTAFLSSVQVLEEEVTKLKHMYEHELEKLRRHLDDVNHEKSHFQVQSVKNESVASQLQDQLHQETDKNKSMFDQMNVLHRTIAQKEHELHEAKMALQRPLGDLEQLQRDYMNVLRENQDLKRRYERETINRQEAEEKIHTLQSKMDFQQQVSAQEMEDIRMRLESSANTILHLESKVRETGKTDNNLVEMLQKVRETAQAELDRYKMESEENFSRSITALKAQMDIDSRNTETISAENRRMHSEVDELTSKIRNLRGQIETLETQKKNLEDVLDQERHRSADHIQRLEKKLRELNDLLFQKMREANAAKDAQVPLKAEIEAFKTLLEEEEKRLRLPLRMTSSRTVLPPVIPPPSIPTPPAPIPTPPVPSYTPPVYSQTPPPPLIHSPRPPSATSRQFITTSTDFDASSTQILKTSGDFRTSTTQVKQPSPPPSPNVQRVDLDLTEPGEELLDTCTTPAVFDSSNPVTSMPETYVPEMSIPAPPVMPEGTMPMPILGPVEGPVSSSARVQSAPAGTRSRVHVVPTYLGQGKDYFDEMFNDLKRTTLQTRPRSSPAERPPYSSTFYDYTTSSCSATGPLKILEVNQEGKYVRIVNTSDSMDEEIGGYMIQQNVGGHPVAVYRFPPRTRHKASSTCTVYAGCNDPILHQPPQAFVWKEQERWGSGPECTTILCKPNGQAIAWTTAAHRFSKNAYDDVQPGNGEYADSEVGKPANELTDLGYNVNAEKPEPVFLRREKTSPPLLPAQKHPHGDYTLNHTHPHHCQPRQLTYGNDNSSVDRQSRSQSARPDPIPGQPYAGASARRMGSAPLRRYTPPNSATIRGSGGVANKAAGTIRFGPPSPFLSPLQQEFTQAYHNRETALHYA
ncbi:centrobin isoform X2 [Lingula anatina]|uniref:Centrobin isoform X2 n=1 Tax=Lingula anatina TaxID=7574 RepID=A0A1S3JCP8_LINAN|nr:centrobin isoform X2 [Lingula anatina]|eukprot:XP_013408098.1 centrobin isoform X2 [Lingula anatina]